MNLKFRKLLLLALVLNMPSAWSQYAAKSNYYTHNKYKQKYDADRSNKFGVSVGLSGGIIRNLKPTIISEDYFYNFTLDPVKKLGWHAGAFFLHQFEESRFAGYFEVSFLSQGSGLHFNNEQTGFNYDMNFNYEYANVVVIPRWYLMDDNKNLYVGVGPHLGFVTSDRIAYDSHNSGQTEFGLDSYQSQQLERVLVGRTNFGASLDLGWVVHRFDIGLRLNYSFTDAVEALPNSYNFINNDNRIISAQFMLKMDLSGNK